MTEDFMIRIIVISVMVAIFAVFLPDVALAKGDSSTSNLTVKVEVTQDNCKINNDETRVVEFGAMLIYDLDKAVQDVPIDITCDEEPQGTLSLAINGSSSTFNSRAVQTDVPGLGITFTAPESETLLDLNTYYDVSKLFGMSSKMGSFTLKAHLVRDGETQLKGGEFNASATLLWQVS
ncbi:TPA: fimbrial protein [Salmonella enterica]